MPGGLDGEASQESILLRESTQIQCPPPYSPVGALGGGGDPPRTWAACHPEPCLDVMGRGLPAWFPRWGRRYFRSPVGLDRSRNRDSFFPITKLGRPKLPYSFVLVERLGNFAPPRVSAESGGVGKEGPPAPSPIVE